MRAYYDRITNTLRARAIVRYVTVATVVVTSSYIASIVAANDRHMPPNTPAYTNTDNATQSTQAPNEALLSTQETADTSTSDTTSVSLNSTQSSNDSENGASSNTATVQVDGKTVEVNGTGDVHKVIQSDNGITTVDISSNSNANSSNNSNIDISIQSSSDTTGNN